MDKTDESTDERPSWKERARQQRRAAYLRAKAQRENDPKYQAAKEAMKARQREAYRAAKERQKASATERSQTRQHARHEQLKGMVKPASRVPLNGHGETKR